MLILDLHLCNKWYDMFEAGIKLEEYREDKEYWRRRLLLPDGNYKPFTHLRLHRGYSSTNMLLEIRNMRFDFGNTKWGAPLHKVHIIRVKKNGTEYVTIGTSRVN